MKKILISTSLPDTIRQDARLELGRIASDDGHIFDGEILEARKAEKGTVLSILISQEDLKDDINNNELFINRVKEIIKINVDNSAFSVESLCEEVGISRMHLNRKLKDLIDMSPGQLIRSMRLRQAAFLLIKNQAKISEVAYDVGYSSLSHFSNSFHDHFHLSPTAFVNKYHGIKDGKVLKDIFMER